MPVFDFTSPSGKKYSVTGPEGATREQAWEILQQQHPEVLNDKAEPSTLSQLAAGPISFGKGAAKGIVGLGTDVAHGSLDLAAKGMKAVGVPVGTGKAPLKQAWQDVQGFAHSPNETWAESAGQFTAEAVPFLLAPEMGLSDLAASQARRFVKPVIRGAKGAFEKNPRYAQATGVLSGLGNIIENAAVGGAAAGLPATKEGTLESHLKAAGEGALAGGLVGPTVSGVARDFTGRQVGRHVVAGTLTTTLGAISHAAGVPLHWVGLEGLPVFIAIGQSRLGKAAAAAGETGARKLRSLAQRREPAAIAGTATSEAQ